MSPLNRGSSISMAFRVAISVVSSLSRLLFKKSATTAIDGGLKYCFLVFVVDVAAAVADIVVVVAIVAVAVVVIVRSYFGSR